MEIKALIGSFEIGSALTSIFLNIVLTILITTKSPKQLGSYKYLMMMISVFEIFYSILDLVIFPVIFSTESIFLVISYSKYNIIPKPVLRALISSWCGLYGFSMGMFAIHFVYRYLVASGSQYLKTFDGFGIVYWFAIPLSYGIVWALICHFGFSYPEKINNSIKYQIFAYLDWEVDNTAYIGPYFYQTQDDGSVETDLQAFVAICALSLIVISSILAIAYFGIRCYLKINKLMNNSSRSQKYAGLQSQLFYALLSETLIPMILMHFPALFMYSSVYLNNGLTLTGGLFTITISLFPALDPLPTMFIIKNYRCAIIGMVKATSVIFVKSITQTNPSNSIPMENRSFY